MSLSNLQLAGALKRTQKGNADWYYGGDNEVWADLAAAKAGVPSPIRPGKTVGVFVAGKIVEYWWPDPAHIADGDLVLKTPDLSGKVDTGSDAVLGNITVEGINVTGIDPLNITIDGQHAHAPINSHVINMPNGTAQKILSSSISNIDGKTRSFNILSGSLNTGENDENVSVFPPQQRAGHTYETLASMSDIADVNASTSAEASAREAADTTLQTNIDNEASARSANDTAILNSAKAYADGLLVSVYKDCGNWDASSGTFPISGGTGTSGAIKAGNAFEISVAGTIAGEAFDIGDLIRALVDAPGQTLSNWARSEHNTQQATESERGTAKIADQTTIQTESTTNDATIVTPKKFWSGWERIKQIAATITGLWNFTGGLQSNGSDVEVKANKNQNNGYAGLNGTSVDPQQGGTGFSTYTTGDILYASSSTTLAKLPDVTTGNVLLSGGTGSAPAYGKVGLTTHVSDVLPVVNGGTGSATQNFVDLSSNQSSIGGNKTFTGTTTVSSSTPTLQLQTSGDGAVASMNRSTTSNTVSWTNSIIQVAGSGNALKFNGTNQSISGPDTGLPTGTNVTFSVSMWVKGSSFSVTWGSSTSGISILLNANLLFLSNGSTVLVNGGSIGTYNDGNWHHIVIIINSNTISAYNNGTQIGSSSPIGAYNIISNGTFSNAGFFGGSSYVSNGSLDQLLVYNTALNSGNISAIYNSGGGNSSTIPTTGLIRRYEFEDGAPSTTISDTNPGTKYNLTIANYVTGMWLGSGNGKVPTSNSTTSGTLLLSNDGIFANEKGTYRLSDAQGGTYLQGYTVKKYINGALIPEITGFDGNTYFSATNMSESTRSLSSVGTDNLAVGTYATTNAAPTNGLIVSGSLGVGTSAPVSKAAIAGNLTIGASYAGTNAAPTNGLLAQGNVSIGTTTNSAALHIGSTTTSSATVARGLYYAGIVQANANNDTLVKLDLAGSYTTTGGTALLGSLVIANTGSGYTNGTYSSVPLTGGTGTGATAQITVAGGIVTAVSIVTSNGLQTTNVTSGSGYLVTDTLSASNTNLGGTGSGLSITLTGNNLAYSGVSQADIRANNIFPVAFPSASPGGSGQIGSSTTPYAGISAQTYFARLIRNFPGSNIDFLSSTIGSYMGTWYTSTGNLVIGQGFGNPIADSGYRLDVVGTGRYSGIISTSNGLARGLYLNQTINPVANNDTLVGLDIQPTFGVGSTAIQTLGIPTGGSGYTNGTGTFTLTGGTGTGATASITRVSGVVTIVTITNQGTGYTVGDILSASIPSGSGFSITVTAVGLTNVQNFALRTSGSIASTVGNTFTPILALTLVTSGGTVSTGTYYYKVVAYDTLGNPSNVSNEVSGSVTSGQYNQLRWQAWPGAVKYRLYRYTTSGATTSAYVDLAFTASTGQPPNIALADSVNSIFAGNDNIPTINNFTPSNILTPSGSIFGNSIKVYTAYNATGDNQTFIHNQLISHQVTGNPAGIAYNNISSVALDIAASTTYSLRVNRDIAPLTTNSVALGTGTLAFANTYSSTVRTDNIIALNSGTLVLQHASALLNISGNNGNSITTTGGSIPKTMQFGGTITHTTASSIVYSVGITSNTRSSAASQSLVGLYCAPVFETTGVVSTLSGATVTTGLSFNLSGNFTTTGGTGSGLNIAIVANNSGVMAASNPSLGARGSGYTAGDVVTVTGVPLQGGGTTSISFTIATLVPTITAYSAKFDNGPINLGSAPSTASDLTQILTRNSTTGTIERTTAASIGVPSAMRLTGSGTGSATTISIPHGLTGVTSNSIFTISALNADSAGYSYVTSDAANINIVYTVAPASGTNNLSYNLIIKP